MRGSGFDGGGRRREPQHRVAPLDLRAPHGSSTAGKPGVDYLKGRYAMKSA